MTKITQAALAMLVAIATLCGTGAASAQTAQGDWHGSLSVPPGIALRIGVTITSRPDGGLDGVLLSPDQTPDPLPLDEVKLDAGLLSFSLKRIGLSFTGRWDSDRKAWTGEVRQGALIPLVLTAGKLDPLPVLSGMDGDWSGAIFPAGATIRLVIHVRNSPAGTVVTLDSPDQAAFGIPLNTLTRTGQSITFEINGSRFEGTLSGDSRQIEGSWNGAVYKGPLVFTRRDAAASKANRPQTPRPPFPYRSEEVTVESVAGVKLAGTLTLPAGKGPYPAAVLITGSGAQDRDETVFGHKPFAVIADRLARDGIAVLRVDDRGFAKSTGSFAAATDDDFALDAAANVAFLRTRADIDPARIGLIGHSEGGLVAPKVAVKDPKLAFIVLMAGPGAPLSEVLRAQRAALAPAMGLSPERIRQSQVLLDRVDAAMRGATDDADARARALAVLKADGGDLVPTPAQAESLAMQLSSGWMRNLVDYDPAPTLEKVRCPILGLYGSKDGQVLAAQNLPAVRRATRQNPDVTLVELPDLNHLFQTARTGAIGEYGDLEETIAPIALDTMSAWIKRRLAR